MIRKKIKNKRKNRDIIKRKVEVGIEAEAEVEVEVGIKINREVRDREDLILVIVDPKEDLNILDLINKYNFI